MAKKKKVFNGTGFEQVDAVETNGNLTYVEKSDGSSDWVSPHELYDDDEWGDAFKNFDPTRERFGSDY